MVEVFTTNACGNSPKSAFVEQLGIALVVGDLGFLSNLLSDQFVWELADGQILSGKPLAKYFPADVQSIRIRHALSHGKVGAVNGYWSDNKNNNYHFCHVIEFTNTKFTHVSRVYSYHQRP